MDLENPGPDYSSGYGAIDAREAVDLIRADTLDEVVVEDRIVRPEQEGVYMLEVLPDQAELKVTLVWDDFPADPLAAHALVNDLDLVVTDPSGQRHFPWTLDPSEPQQPARRDREDHTNNVEQIHVENPLEGSWRVTVRATAAPECEQTYSLIASPGPLEPMMPQELPAELE
jgi:hypothetical protein